jgi:hypothetical protein
MFKHTSSTVSLLLYEKDELKFRSYLEKIEILLHQICNSLKCFSKRFRSVEEPYSKAVGNPKPTKKKRKPDLSVLLPSILAIVESTCSAEEKCRRLSNEHP